MEQRNIENLDHQAEIHQDVKLQNEHHQDEIHPTLVAAFDGKKESQMLTKVRSNFSFFGGISLIFGSFFTLFFYKAGIGINVFAFTLLMLFLLSIIMKLLSCPMKLGTKLYYVGAALLGLSTAFTSSEILQFLNFIGILLLLNISMLHQFYEDTTWDISKYIFRMIGLLFQSIASIGLPFVDCFHYMKHTKVFKHDKTRNIFVGLLISVPFLFLVTALLASADLLFGRMTKKMLDTIFSADIIGIIFMIAFGFLACYCILCGAVSKVGLPEKKQVTKADASIAITFMTILLLVYAIFCGIQITYLFANGVFVLPEEFTFAQYARRGFFELLTVTVINVLLILICKAFFKESKVLRIVITAITGCTYIMIASATYRMLLYIGAYHLTFLRLFVLLSLLIFTLVLTGILIAEYKKGFPLFSYCVFVVSICYILFSLGKPDYFIASYMARQIDVFNKVDIRYMVYDLSLDAAPIVVPLLSEENRLEVGITNFEHDSGKADTSVDLRKQYYKKIYEEVGEREMKDFNLCVHLAYSVAKEYPLP